MKSNREMVLEEDVKMLQRALRNIIENEYGAPEQAGEAMGPNTYRYLVARGYLERKGSYERVD